MNKSRGIGMGENWGQELPMLLSPPTRCKGHVHYVCLAVLARATQFVVWAPGPWIHGSGPGGKEGQGCPGLRDHKPWSIQQEIGSSMQDDTDAGAWQRGSTQIPELGHMQVDGGKYYGVQIYS